MLPWNWTVGHHCRELFTGRMLRLGLVFTAAGAAGAALAARTTLTTRAAWAPGWPHLLQLLELLGRQYLLKLRLHLSLQRRHLLLLVVGQVELLLSAWGEQVEPAGSATRAALCAGFRRWRTFTGRRRTSLFLSD